MTSMTSLFQCCFVLGFCCISWGLICILPLLSFPKSRFNFSMPLSVSVIVLVDQCNLLLSCSSFFKLFFAVLLKS